MKILFSIALLLFCSSIGYSQSNGKITGKVNDAATHQAIEYATITVADKQTKKVINGAITDARGAFEVNELPAGVYRVTIEFLGYKKNIFDSVWLRSNKSVASLNSVFLSSAGQDLQGVTVTANAPAIENKIDKLVYNAANDITSQGGVALDILKKVPMVNVDIDGNVELQGNSNIRFLINGKPSSVFGNSITVPLPPFPPARYKV
ncbi:MAG: carboxypeptidase regulatory-like domain-containing protein [Chitinophagales bacterium]